MSGAIDLSKPSHLPPIASSKLVNPVMLPPGLPKLWTKAAADRIVEHRRYNWDSAGQFQQRPYFRRALSYQHVWFQANQVCCGCPYPVAIGHDKAIVDPGVAAIYPAQVMERFLEGYETGVHLRIAFGDRHQPSDPA